MSVVIAVILFILSQGIVCILLMCTIFRVRCRPNILLYEIIVTYVCGYDVDVSRSTVPGVHQSMIEATEHPQLCVQTDVSLTIYHVGTSRDTYTTDNI